MTLSVRSARPRDRIAVAMFAGTWLVAAVARAQSGEAPVPSSAPQTGAAAPRTGRTSALSWVRLPGAEACIAAPALAAAVEARLGRRVFVPPSDAELSVEGTIAYRPEARKFHASFRVADRDGKVLGSRDVDESATSCDKLGDRLAFVLSVLIDPEAALAPAEPPTAAANDPPPEPAPRASAERVTPVQAGGPPPAPPAPPRPTPSGTWRWMAAAEFGGSAGLVPDVGWVIAGSVLVTPPRWPGLRAKASSFLPSSRRIEGLALAEIGLVAGELAVCPLEARRAPFGITACLGAFVGQLSARGQGFPDSRGYSTTVGGGVLEAVAELAFTRWLSLTLSPALVVPLSRARLAYDDAASVRRTIFELSAVGGSVALGLAIGSR